MAKFYGEIGYVATTETKPGVWKSTVAKKMYSGDINRISRKWANTQSINGDINIMSEISIVADPFLIDNLHTIKYVKLHGQRWRVESIEYQPPRLLLSIGGLYNGETPGDE